MFSHDLGGVVAGEGDSSGDHVVERGSEAVDVGPAVDVDFAADLLGGDVVGRAVRLARLALGGLDVGGFAGQTHVRQLHDAVGVDHDVLGLDVAVYEAVVVGVGEGVSDLDDDVDGFLLAEAVAAGEVVGDGLALDVFHDEVVVAAGLADVDGLDDVGVVELAGGLAFFVEALDVLGVFAEAAGQDLDRDRAVEAELLGFVDERHRPGPDLAQDLVAGNLVGRGLVLFDALLEPLGLAGRDVAQLDHQLPQHYGSDLRPLLKLLQRVAELVIRAEPLIDRHLAEHRVIIRFGRHSFTLVAQGPHPYAVMKPGIRLQRVHPITPPRVIIGLCEPLSIPNFLILPHRQHHCQGNRPFLPGGLILSIRGVTGRGLTGRGIPGRRFKVDLDVKAGKLMTF